MTPQTRKMNEARWRTREWGGGTAVMSLISIARTLRSKEIAKSCDRLVDLACRFPSNRELFTLVNTGRSTVEVFEEASREIFQEIEALVVLVKTRQDTAARRGLMCAVAITLMWQTVYQRWQDARAYVYFEDVCREVCQTQRQYGVRPFRDYLAVLEASGMGRKDVWRSSPDMPNTPDVGECTMDVLHWVRLDVVDDFGAYVKSQRM